MYYKIFFSIVFPGSLLFCFLQPDGKAPARKSGAGKKVIGIKH
jgi:hypothetical protein